MPASSNSVLPGFGPFVSPAGIDLMIESLNVDGAHSFFLTPVPSRREPNR
jgi:hypothetical protein